MMDEWDRMSTRERADVVMAQLARGDYPDEGHAQALVNEVERLRPFETLAEALGEWQNQTTDEVERLRPIEARARDARRGNASETDEYERGWIAAASGILGEDA